jgi:Mrp family chromosome partitioning ATPase/capsular polysaccharide biosynthesis protein
MSSADHPSRQRTLADYLAILQRRKWVAIVPLVLVPIVAFVYSSGQDATYAASSEVLLSRQDLGSVLSGGTNPDVFTDADRFATTQAALARVPEVARRAVQRAGVSGVGPGDLLASSSVTTRGNADLLSFTVEDGDPDVAASLVNAYARAFTDYRRELDTAALASARKDLERNLAALRREGATDTAFYRNLAQKVQELRTMELLQSRAEVVKTAGDASQVAPTPRRNAMLGAALGLLLGLGAVFLWEALDRRVRDEEEIHRTLGIPLLARIPAPRGDRLAMLDDPSAADAEAVRRLRSSIEFANLDVRAKVLMVTSCVGDEGKTTTISNLAIALARAGHRVALVDLDLRKPMIGRFFGLELRPGLADAAIERIELERALVQINLGAAEPIRLARSTRRLPTTEDESGDRRHGDGQLYVLPAGFLPASPGELVGTEAVAGILARLREQMDFVLVDAPPMLTVSDAATLSTRVDGVAVVVRLGLVNRPMLRDLARELEASPAPKLGFILTGAGAAEQYAVAAYTRGRGVHPSQPAARPVRRAAPEPPEPSEPQPALSERPSSPRAG